MERVTILIACYNDEDYIERAIESALNQDYKGDLVVCVIDDGSSDRSLELSKLFMKRPSLDNHQNCKVTFQENMGRNGNVKMVVIEKQNGGPSDARNIGIGYTHPHTDIYAVLDSDDEMYENKISRCVGVMSEDMDSIGVVYGDYDTYHTSTGKKIREFKEPYSRRRLVRECIVHSGSIINKKALDAVCEETGFYDVNMRTCEDYDLWMRISEKFLIAHIPESLTLVRVTGDNSSFIVNKEIWEKNWTRLMEKMQQRLYAKQ